MPEGNGKMILIADLEGNGFLETIDKIWCVVFKEYHKDNWWLFTDEEYPKSLDKVENLHIYGIKCLPSLFRKGNQMFWHNGFVYDIPVLNKLLPQYNNLFKKPDIKDTLVMSRVLNPDRLSGHALKEWAVKLKGPQKVEQEVWDRWDPNMIKRCKNDVLITEGVLDALLVEIKKNERLFN